MFLFLDTWDEALYFKETSICLTGAWALKHVLFSLRIKVFKTNLKKPSLVEIYYYLSIAFIRLCLLECIQCYMSKISQSSWKKQVYRNFQLVELIVCDSDCGLHFILQWHIAFIPLLKQQNIKIGLLSLFYFLILPWWLNLTLTSSSQSILFSFLLRPELFCFFLVSFAIPTFPFPQNTKQSF